MNIRENIKSDIAESKATNALEKVKKEIDTFFKYIDCNADGIITAENMYNGMKNMKPM
jgi:Ca2+-binding EF-hand superfamily protein